MIGVIEIATDFVGYQMGGVQVMSFADHVFYIVLIFATSTSFIVAWPVNYILLAEEVKGKCHH